VTRAQAAPESDWSGAPLYRRYVEGTLQHVHDSSPTVVLGPKDRIIIMSDLHLGDGGRRDDFRHNAGLVEAVLRDRYLAEGWTLVLNGDIEELQRFSYASIRAKWKPVLSLFEEFGRRTSLYKIVGNHDQALHAHAPRTVPRPLLDGVRLTFDANELFLFHGHQATIFFERFNGVSGFFLKYVVNALRIPNSPVMYESRRKYLTEHRVYTFSASRKIVSIIGHTHRPLFESLSKIDTLRFRIEQLCRDYPTVSPRARAAIETAVALYRRDLTRLWEKDREEGLRGSLYNEQIWIPCLFNSGCGIGKRGVTAIEIAGGEIALVHWFDRTRGETHLTQEARPAERLGSSDYFRTVIKQDRLEYIFSRIRLLA
jgi:UDP-2,3-diacylglucosamine pyrophosphatase LpxH